MGGKGNWVAFLQGTGWTILLKEGLPAAMGQAGLLQVCLGLPPPASCATPGAVAVAMVLDTLGCCVYYRCTVGSANCRGEDWNRHLAGMLLHPDGVQERAMGIAHIHHLATSYSRQCLHSIDSLVLGIHIPALACILHRAPIVLCSSFVGMPCAGKGDGDGARERGPQRPQAMDVFGGTEGQVKASRCRLARKRDDESSSLYCLASSSRRLPR